MQMETCAYSSCTGAKPVLPCPPLQVGELSRPWWQGLPTPAALQLPGLESIPRKIRKKVGGAEGWQEGQEV